MPSKYKLHSQATHFFGSSHSYHGQMSSLYCVLIIYMYAYACAFYYITETANSLYQNRAGLNLYFDGTQVYIVVACSFAAFSGSYAPNRKGSTQT